MKDIGSKMVRDCTIEQLQAEIARRNEQDPEWQRRNAILDAVEAELDARDAALDARIADEPYNVTARGQSQS